MSDSHPLNSIFPLSFLLSLFLLFPPLLRARNALLRSLFEPCYQYRRNRLSASQRIVGWDHPYFL